MKYTATFFFILFMFNIINVQAQQDTVEKSLFGVQTGLLGVWGYNESNLTNRIALRTEIGVDAGLFGGSFYDRNGVVFVPVITAEPRWYYNIGKRSRKNKKTINNSANFLSLDLSYNPDWFQISSVENVRAAEQVSVIPKWAIKRTIGRDVVYELGIGIGYRYYFLKQYGFFENEGELTAELHLRIGYSF